MLGIITGKVSPTIHRSLPDRTRPSSLSTTSRGMKNSTPMRRRHDATTPRRDDATTLHDAVFLYQVVSLKLRERTNELLHHRADARHQLNSTSGRPEKNQHHATMEHTRRSTKKTPPTYWATAFLLLCFLLPSCNRCPAGISYSSNGTTFTLLIFEFFSNLTTPSISENSV